MKQLSYDTIILGLGGMGSAALYQLAKRGVRICGIERHGVAHDLGSSHGAARMIRKAYYEHPDYIPLLHRAYDLWNELGAQCGRELLVTSGLLFSGKPDSTEIRGLESCYAAHDLPHERVDAAEATRRYPQFVLPADHVVYIDPIAGYLRVEQCVEAHITLARQHGADVFIHEDATAWHADDEGVTLTTQRRTIRARSLVITAGPWAAGLLEELGVTAQILRKVQLWYDSPNLNDFRGPAFLSFFVERDFGSFYGFPAFDEHGLKIAEHSGGTPVEDPSDVNRGLTTDDESLVLQFMNEIFPAFAPRRTRFSVCMYTMSPDHHFIIDKHPRHDNVVIAGGFSGHGFKFASVVGEILADLALEGDTRHPIGFLGLQRFNS